MAHVNIGKVDAESYNALLELNGTAVAAALAAGLDPLILELIKIRTSQINGCAFCLRMHTRDAIKLGETPDRLAVLAAWWESQYFSEIEKAALGLAERVASVSSAHSSGIDEPDLSTVLTDAQIAGVTWLAIVMNAWNRVAILSHYPVAP